MNESTEGALGKTRDPPETTTGISRVEISNIGLKLPLINVANTRSREGSTRNPADTYAATASHCGVDWELSSDFFLRLLYLTVAVHYEFALRYRLTLFHLRYRRGLNL